MTNTITFKWNTGNIEIAACAVLDMTASQLKNLVKTATANAEEVKNQIADYIQSEIDKLNPKSEYDKKMIAQYNKLISAAVGERRQTAQEKAIARIMKNCSAAMADKYMGVIHDSEMYCVLDGFRLVRYAAPLENFPTAAQTFDTNKAIGDKSRYNIKLALPTVKDLKADMKIAKLSGMDVNRIHVIRKGKCLDFGYDFGYGMPMVNAKWLIDMIEALPDAAAYAVKDYSCNPIYFTDGENDGILLPIRKMQEYAAAPADEEKTVEAVEEKPIEKPVEEVKTSEEVKDDSAPAVDEVKKDPAPVSAEKLNQIEAPLENRQVYGYKPDGNTVVAHRWKVYHVTGNLYLRETVTDKYGQRFANIVLMHPCAKIGLDMGSIGDYQLKNYSADFLAERVGFSTVEEFNAHISAVIENGEYIRNSYIAFVRQYNSTLAQRMEVCKADYLERREKREAERRAEYIRKQEQQRREHEQEIADEINQAEQTIINGGKIDNTVTDGKCLFLRLFEKHGVKVAIRSKGWIIEKLVYVLQNADGGAQVYFRKSSKYEKISGGFTSAYWELREILLNAQKEAEEAAKEAPAETVSTDTAEDPAPVATSTPVQAAQDTAEREARQIIAAISPAIMRLFCASVRDGCRPYKTGLDRTRPDKSGVSARWTVDGRTVHNTS